MELDKRTAIVMGVWRVIATQGIGAVSVRSVAAAAGVSPGRVQHYFPTKAELVRASVEAMLHGAALVNPAAAGDPADARTLESLLMHALGPAAESRAGTSIFYSYVAASVADPWIAEALAEAKRGVVESVRECLRARGVAGREAGPRARALVMIADGATQAVFLGSATPAEARRAIRSAISSALA